MNKLKRNALIITIISLIVMVFSLFDLFGQKNLPIPLTVTLMIFGIGFTFMGPAIMLFPLVIERRRKIANRSFLFSLLLIAIGVFSMWKQFLGARIEIIFGVLIICFFYGTLTLKNKYDKWQAYARTKYDALFLSLFDFVGIGCLILGFLFRIQHWPMAELMTLIGLVALAVGLLAWNYKFKKEVIFRKETEDKLKVSLEEIEIQHEKLEEKQKEIIDSINYAKRIQNSQMPTERYIENHLNRLKRN